MFPVRDTIPSRHPPIMTWMLIAGNVLVFLLEVRLPSPQLERFFYLFGIVPARFSDPPWAAWVGLTAHDYWPFLTSMFLHGGWLHLVGNVWFLWIFGDNVEDRMGALRFVVFYLACGIGAGVVHCFTSPGSTVPTVGASGAIAGVMGAYLFLFPRSRIIALFPVLFYPVFFEIPAVLYIVFWFWIQVWSGVLTIAGPAQVGGIAFWAHVGGFLSGALAHRMFVRSRRAHRSLASDGGGAFR